MRAAGSGNPSAHRGNWALVAAIVGSGMSFIDGSAVNVALPVLQRDLNTSLASAQWVIEGYSLFLSALMLIGGALGDLYGRRRVYAAGVGLFALASIPCAFAPNIEFLIVARCIQGIGGALAVPGSLALISASFPPETRGRAIGTWSGFASLTAAIGPLLGGWLVQIGSWRWVFVINVPLAAIVLVILRLHVDESRNDDADRHLDVSGAALATFGLGALVYGLIRLQGGTLDPIGLAVTLAGVLGMAAFVIVERRETHPMVRLDLFGSRTFTMANLYTFLLYATIGGSLYFLPFDLINVQGYPPSAAGAALLPFVAIVFVLSRFAGGLLARIGPRLPLVAGAALAAAAFAVFASAGVGNSYWTTFFPGAVLLGFGGALFIAPLTTTVMDSVSSSSAGIASGINNAVSRVAGLLAIAAFGISLATVFEARLARELATVQLAPATRTAIARDRSMIVAGQVPPEITAARERDVVATAVRASFADGFRAVMLLSAAVALLAALVGLDKTFEMQASSR